MGVDLLDRPDGGPPAAPLAVEGRAVEEGSPQSETQNLQSSQARYKPGEISGCVVLDHPRQAGDQLCLAAPSSVSGFCLNIVVLIVRIPLSLLSLLIQPFHLPCHFYLDIPHVFAELAGGAGEPAAARNTVLTARLPVYLLIQTLQAWGCNNSTL